MQGQGAEPGAVASIRFSGKAPTGREVWFRADRELDGDLRFEIDFTPWARALLQGPDRTPAVRAIVGGHQVADGVANMVHPLREVRDGAIANVVHVVLPTHSLAFVIGQVLTPEGLPLADAPVAFLRETGAFPQLRSQSLTDEAGRFSLESRYPEDLLLAVVSRPWRPLTLRLQTVPGATIDLGILTLEVGAILEGRMSEGGLPGGIAIYGQGGGARDWLMGHLLDWYGDGLAYNMLNIYLDLEGAFSEGGLEPGRSYTLFATGGRHGCRMSGFNDIQEVEAPARGLVYEPVMPRIDFEVRGPGGLGVTGAHVRTLQVIQGEPTWFSCYTYDGVTAFQVVADEDLEFQVTHSAYLLERRLIPALRRGERRTERFDLTPHPTGSLHLRVLDGEGDPIPRISVEVVLPREHPGRGWNAHLRSEDGLYLLEGMPVGPQELIVLGTTHSPRMYLEARVAVQVQSNPDPVPEVSLTLELGGRLTVAATGQAGEPIDATCELRTVAGEPVPITFGFVDPTRGHYIEHESRPHPGVLERGARGDVLLPLPAGDYVLSARDGPRREAQQAITIAPGSTTHATLVLR